jgi:hypothetical protein
MKKDGQATIKRVGKTSADCQVKERAPPGRRTG